MFSLALNIPQINDATSFYRAAFPMGDLRKRCKNLNGIAISVWSEATLRCADGAFFQRPYTNEHRGAIQMAIEVGRKVWVDYDDFLLGIPTDNPTHQTYMSKQVQDNVKWILQNASVVTVSTTFLAQLYQPYCKNIRVVPNALDTELKSVRDRQTPKGRHKIIAWRGSNTHQRDLFRHAGAILSTSRDPANKEWAWHFIGYNPWFLTDSMPHTQTFITNGMSPIEYHHHISLLQASAFMVPLDESPFNRCKSNIAWMEAAFAGAASLVPNWDEWSKPGAITYKNEAEFKAGLYAIINGEVDVVAKAKESYDFILQELTLTKVNEARIDVLCELFECSRADLGVG
jgi:hypothetical protein